MDDWRDTSMKVAIEAIEYYLPQTVETCKDLEKENPTWPAEKLEAKTGIKKRHIADSSETAVDMAILAAKRLFSSGVPTEDIDLLILVTQSPDYVLPTSACILQDRLGLKTSCMAFDVNLGCSGFIYNLAIAGSLIQSGIAGKALIICSETYTKYIDKSDRTCRPIFSDGASAVLLGPCKNQSIGPFDLGTDGAGFSNLIVPSSGMRHNTHGKPDRRLFMDGAKLFMFTMGMVPRCINALLSKAEMKLQDIDMFIFHQASKVVIDNIIRRMALPEKKVFVNYDRIGNTVSASIPIALKDAASEGRLRRGDRLMLIGFGVGYSWGSCLIRWEVDA